MYDVSGNLLNGIKSMYVKNLVCVRIKRGESECFRVNSGGEQGCIMSLWLFSVYMDAVKMGMGRTGVNFQEEGREGEIARPPVCR